MENNQQQQGERRKDSRRNRTEEELEKDRERQINLGRNSSLELKRGRRKLRKKFDSGRARQTARKAEAKRQIDAR